VCKATYTACGHNRYSTLIHATYALGLALSPGTCRNAYLEKAVTYRRDTFERLSVQGVKTRCAQSQKLSQECVQQAAFATCLGFVHGLKAAIGVGLQFTYRSTMQGAAAEGPLRVGA
jgi:hypothetical protein